MTSYEPKADPRVRPRLRVFRGVRSIDEARLHVNLTTGLLVLVGLSALLDIIQHPLWSGGIALVLILTAVALHARPSLPTAVFALVVALVLFVLAVRPFFYPVPSGLDSSELVSFYMRRNESSLFSLLIAASAFHLCYLARRFPRFRSVVASSERRLTSGCS